MIGLIFTSIEIVVGVLKELHQKVPRRLYDKSAPRIHRGRRRSSLDDGHA